MMTKKYLKQRIKELENALRRIGIAADNEASNTAICAKHEISKYTLNYSKLEITQDGKLKVTFREV